MKNAFLLLVAAAALAKAGPGLVPETPSTAPDCFCTWKPDSETGHHSFEALWEFRSDGNRTVRLNYQHMGRVFVT